MGKKSITLEINNFNREKKLQTSLRIKSRKQSSTKTNKDKNARAGDQISINGRRSEVGKKIWHFGAFALLNNSRRFHQVIFVNRSERAVKRDSAMQHYISVI